MSSSSAGTKEKNGSVVTSGGRAGDVWGECPPQPATRPSNAFVRWAYYRDIADKAIRSGRQRGVSA
jgi:hypothetical protein